MTKTAATLSKHSKNYTFGFLITFFHIVEWILLIFKNALLFKNSLDDYFEHFALRPP